MGSDLGMVLGYRYLLSDNNHFVRIHLSLFRLDILSHHHCIPEYISMDNRHWTDLYHKKEQHYSNHLKILLCNGKQSCLIYIFYEHCVILHTTYIYSYLGRMFHRVGNLHDFLVLSLHILSHFRYTYQVRCTECSSLCIIRYNFLLHHLHAILFLLEQIDRWHNVSRSRRQKNASTSFTSALFFLNLTYRFIRFNKCIRSRTETAEWNDFDV